MSKYVILKAIVAAVLAIIVHRMIGVGSGNTNAHLLVMALQILASI